MRSAGVAGMAALMMLAACGSSNEAPGDGESASAIIPAATSEAPKGRFEPRNECIELPGAKTFFLALENAVSARDADLLLQNTSADVKLDFGGGGGLTTFRERLSDKQGQLWSALDAATTMGCAHADNGDLVLPWYAEQPMDGIDPATSLIVTGKDVPLRNGPGAQDTQLATVSWDAVTLVNGLDKDAAAQHVTTSDGTEGYITTDRLRSPLDYRLRVAPMGDSWQIVSFVRGG